MENTLSENSLSENTLYALRLTLYALHFTLKITLLRGKNPIKTREFKDSPVPAWREYQVEII